MCYDSSFVGTEEEIAKENELQYILRIDRLIGAIAKSKCWISVVVMEDSLLSNSEYADGRIQRP